MFQDFRQYEDGATIDTDVCIIGAGAAGITIALELRDSARDVLLLESGEMLFNPEIQALNEGTLVYGDSAPLDASRLRFFGGTTNHWTGHCRPLDAIDFEKRDWVPHSGWPITRAELDPYYRRAAELCQIEPFEMEAPTPTDQDRYPVPFDPKRVVNRRLQSSPPIRFGDEYGKDLERTRNVSVLLHANVVELVSNEGASRVEGIRIRTVTGKSGTVRARIVVVACGAIENARLLLASDGIERDGMGNRHGLVGRFFQVHPHSLAAFAVPLVPLERFEPYVTYAARPALSEDLQRRQRILNSALSVGYGYDRNPGYLALRQLGKDLTSWRWGDETGDHLLGVLEDLDGMFSGLYRRVTNERVLWFSANSEQVPDPESRITLLHERDAAGMRRVKAEWRISDFEKRSARITCRVIGEELARLNLARMRIDPWLLADGGEWPEVTDRYHHMGTTRMADDPRRGVVDRDSRVHGIENLYLAGNSVFATSGYAPPTLTNVALSARLADHLKTDRRG